MPPSLDPHMLFKSALFKEGFLKWTRYYVTIKAWARVVIKPKNSSENPI